MSITLLTARCRRCGRFVKPEFTSPELCDACLDDAFSEFVSAIPLAWKEDR